MWVASLLEFVSYKCWNEWEEEGIYIFTVLVIYPYFACGLEYICFLS